MIGRSKNVHVHGFRGNRRLHISSRVLLKSSYSGMSIISLVEDIPGTCMRRSGCWGDKVHIYPMYGGTQEIETEAFKQGTHERQLVKSAWCDGTRVVGKITPQTQTLNIQKFQKQRAGSILGLNKVRISSRQTIVRD